MKGALYFFVLPYIFYWLLWKDAPHFHPSNFPSKAKGVFFSLADIVFLVPAPSGL
jgi:hypothetical protein